MPLKARIACLKTLSPFSFSRFRCSESYAPLPIEYVPQSCAPRHARSTSFSAILVGIIIFIPLLPSRQRSNGLTEVALDLGGLQTSGKSGRAIIGSHRAWGAKPFILARWHGFGDPFTRNGQRRRLSIFSMRENRENTINAPKMLKE